MKELCNKLPPKEIYDVLHAAEAAGIDLPDSVNEWWFKETEINISKKCLKDLRGGEK